MSAFHLLGLIGIPIFIFLLIFLIKCCLAKEDDKGRRDYKRRKLVNERRPITAFQRYSGDDDEEIVPSASRIYNISGGRRTQTRYPASRTAVGRLAATAPREIDDADFVVVHDPNTVTGRASPVVVPPYPVEPRHPTPHAAAPGLGFATHNPPYPTHNPHPMPGVSPYPPTTAPYPPVVTAPYPDYSNQPPSYAEAVSQPPAQPPVTKEGYVKQAPYNPNY